MPSCAVINCTNSPQKGFKLFAFPSDEARRQKWIHNMRRENWTPTYARICEEHFEESQLEQGRADGIRKPKPNAVPTLFNVSRLSNTTEETPSSSNCRISVRRLSCHETRKRRRRVTKRVQRILFEHNYARWQSKNYYSNEAIQQENHLQVPEVCCEVTIFGNTRTVATNTNIEVENERISALEQEVEMLRIDLKIKESYLNQKKKELEKSIDEKNEILGKFLNHDQIKVLEGGKMSSWSSESIVKGLKFMFALSIEGYDFLRSTGYPLPGYSTLTRRVNSFKLRHGIVGDALEVLKQKIESMEPDHQYCMLI